MVHTYAVVMVYADGNPMTVASKLTAREASTKYDELKEKYKRVPPYIGIVDEDDEERGWLDSYDLWNDTELEASYWTRD